MSWIKLQTSLPKSAKLLVLAEVLRVKRAEALGLAMEWFCWLDEQCTDGSTGMTPRMVNEVIGHKRFVDGLVAIGWAELDADGRVCVVDFDAHNGQSAKARAMTARRIAAGRLSKKSNAASVTEVTEMCAKSNAASVTKTQQVRYQEKEYNNSNIGCRLSNADNECAGEPARTQIEEGTGYEAWLAAVAGAHPSAKLSRVLAADVAEAAREAYERCPGAAAEAELLGAYLASRQSADRYHLAFYRPTGQRRFFCDLEDVICHAKRWAKEFSWKPAKKAVEQSGQGKSAQPHQKAQEGGKERQHQGMASEEQVADFHAALREGKVWG